MDFFGADVALMRNLASHLERVGTELAEIQRGIDSDLTTVDWRGDDADRYRTTWSGGLGASMLAAAAQLQEASSELHADATRQAVTSDLE